MPDNKLTALDNLISPASNDVLYIVDDPLGTPVGKKITIKDFFANVPANTAVTGTLDVSGTSTLVTIVANTANTVSGTYNNLTVTSNNFVLQSSLTPANSSVSMATGKFFWDDDYLYVNTSTGIKRAALSSF